MRVLVTIIAPIYWSLAQASGAARSGFLLTQGSFQHESLLQFPTGEGSLPGESGQLLGKLRLHLPHAPPLTRAGSCVSVCGGAVGCCSPFSPGRGAPADHPPRPGLRWRWRSAAGQRHQRLRAGELRRCRGAAAGAGTAHDPRGTTTPVAKAREVHGLTPSLPLPRTSASATCGRARGSSPGARCRASCGMGASSVPTAITPSSSTPPWGHSPPGCSTSGPEPSQPPMTLPNRSSSSSFVPRLMQVTRGARMGMEICCQFWVSVRVQRPWPCSDMSHLILSVQYTGADRDQCPLGFTPDPGQLYCIGMDPSRWDMRMATGNWCHFAVPPTPSSLCSPDVDECTEGSHACRYNQVCQNAAGSYRCSCPPGYRTLGVGWPCLGTSWALRDTCLPCSSLSSSSPAAAPHLFPPPDVNECLQFPPPCTFECRNLRGSYECLCPAGKTLLPGGQCGTAGMEGGDTTNSMPRDTPLRRQGLSGLPRGRSFYTQLALRRVAKDAGVGARAPPCPTGYIRRNGICTGEPALGTGFEESSETALSPKGTSCPSCCPVHCFVPCGLCCDGKGR